MKKEELVQKFKQNGWDVTFENKYGIFKIKIENTNTILKFNCYTTHYAYRIAINVKGEEEIKEEDFCSIVHFLKKDKPILFEIYEDGMSDKWEKIIRECLEKQMYEKVDFYKEKLNEMLNIREEYTLYITNDSIKKMNQYKNYYLAIEEILKENYDKKLLFDYKKDNQYVNFFVNINYFLCTIKLTIVNGSIELYIVNSEHYIKEKVLMKWSITKKEDIEMNLRRYIDEIGQKQRIRNIFNTSTYFFEKYCALNAIIDDDSSEIYDALRVHYVPNEIEKISAIFCKTKEKKDRIFDNNNYFYFFDEKGILVNRQERTVTIIEKRQEINQRIEEIEKNIS